MNAPIDWLITTASQGAAGLLVWSLQALALLALVWLALKIWRLKSPALRHQVWLFGLVAVAALPLSSIAIQRLPSLQPASPVLNYVIEAPSVIIDFAPQAPDQTLPETAPEKAGAVFPTAPPVKPAGKIPIVRPSLFAAWMIGALIALARVMKNHFGVRRALKRARSIRPADLDCDESIVSMTGVLMTGKVSLRLSTEIHSSILFGVFRPTILLPADIVDWTTPAERAAMIQHELAHAERRDAIVNLFQTALSVIFFFHPLVRYACRQLSLEREMACDDRVVALGASADVYAAAILKAAEHSIISVVAPDGVHQLAIFSTRQVLERRLEMILNTGRARVIAHQWRYLVLPAVLIAVAGFLLIPRYSTKSLSTLSPASASLKPAEGKPVKAFYSLEEQTLIEMIQQVASVIPHQWHYRYRKSGLADERLLFDDFRLYNKRSVITIVPPRPPNFSGSIILTKVEVGDFEVSINGDSAVIDFIGAIHLSIPDQDKEEFITDPYRVKLVRVNGQWQADRRNRSLSVGAMFWPPPPPRVVYPELQGALAEAEKATPVFKIVNNGDAEFSVKASSISVDSQSAGTIHGDFEHRVCRCSASLVQDAVMKLGELELRGEKGVRFSHAEKGVQMLDQDGLKIYARDAIHFKDRFELQWGERSYYGLGSVKASYHLELTRLDIGSFQETRLYRTPDRTGEAITLQQLAQELKDQALRKN